MYARVHASVYDCTDVCLCVCVYEVSLPRPLQAVCTHMTDSTYAPLTVSLLRTR